MRSEWTRLQVPAHAAPAVNNVIVNMATWGVAELTPHLFEANALDSISITTFVFSFSHSGINS